MPDLSNADSFISEMMYWHFSQQTGSPFWLKQKPNLHFDPIKDVKTVADLCLFTDMKDELRNIHIEDLRPGGLPQNLPYGVYESGGTTGSPKRIIVYDEWLDQLIDWRLQGHHPEPGDNTLAMVPTGPHLVGTINQLRAKALGGSFFSIDLDPRWVKKMIARGYTGMVEEYSEHLLDQAEDIVYSQKIKYLITTPPLLARIARRKKLVETLNTSLKLITWGGTQMDIDTLEYLRDQIFTNVPITASYGNTMMLCEAKARLEDSFNGAPIFDPFAPYVMINIVDDQNHKPVAYGNRGRVQVHHVSRYAFYPNMLERDTAVRIEGVKGQTGDSLADIRPVMEVSDQPVIEGVY